MHDLSLVPGVLNIVLKDINGTNGKVCGLLNIIFLIVNLCLRIMYCEYVEKYSCS